MTSRLDRLFALLENCPNASLRTAAAQQLGELAENLPTNVDHIFARLIPLLRSRSWISRVAAAEVIRSIVRHLPNWSVSSDCSTSAIDPQDREPGNNDNGFLSLSDLRLDRVLAQGARLYSMDVRELERPVTKRSVSSATESNDSGDVMKENGPPQSPLAVQRQELNKRLGLDDDNVVTSVLATHSNVSLNHWIASEDLEDKEVPESHTIYQLDVATCVKTAYDASEIKTGKRSACSSEPDSHRLLPKQPRSEPNANVEGAGDDDRCAATWPLDKMCTSLLGDLWALRWETRHGAASGLRELLSEPRHTRQAGKRAGMTELEMQESNSRYLEDIVVRVLCTLALDQLSDFVSDEVVAPVRETAAQLLGVLSRHLSAERVLLVTRHLIYLISLKLSDDRSRCSDQSQTNSADTPTGQPAMWKNNWMIVHGGLLGIKYLLASRKDLRSTLLPLVTPCLVTQLVGSPVSIINTTQPDCSSVTPHSVADEDIRAAAASALIPVVDVDWLMALGAEQAYQLNQRIWQLLRDCTSDLSPSTGPLLQLICVLIRASAAKHQETGFVGQIKEEQSTEQPVKTDPDGIPDSFDVNRMHFQLDVLARLIHHVSSGIRSHALTALQCLLDTWKEQHVPMPPNLLQLIVDQLFHRILLETATSVRGLATKLCIDVIESSDLVVCTHACVDRLDFWLCQTMQPVGIPFPPHLFSALVPANPVTLLPGQLDPSSKAQDPNSPNETKCDSQPEQNDAVPNRISSSHEYGYCIGGSQLVASTPAQQEAFVWETRMCAIRVLARLFSRVCQCTQISVPISKLPSATEGSTSTEPVPAMNLLLPFFLEQLLCGLHLEQRLAMQRFVGGLVLSSWSLRTGCSIPTACTWATMLSGDSPIVQSESGSGINQADLATLSSKLRSRLEACLTEVIYYEEILGLFKLMQEDCRDLVRVLESLNIADDPVFSFKGARTIAQCLTMLDKASQRLNQLSITPLSTNDESQSELITTATYKLDRARSTVERCLASQLHWGSRVELAIASSLSNLNWLLPGRLSLLIRPFMDTIRCVCPTPSPSDLQASKQLTDCWNTHLLPTGSSPSLQRLATACLTRVLQLEWLAHQRKTNPSGSCGLPAPNPSKAAVKVVKNLAASLLESDPQLCTLACQDDTSTNHQPPINPDSLLSDEFDVTRRLPKPLSSSEPIPTAPVDSRTVWHDARYRGSSLALAYLCQTFLQDESNPFDSQTANFEQQQQPLQRLKLGLPGLWNLLWCEPVQLLRNLLHGARDTDVYSTDRECSLQPLLKATLFSGIQHSSLKLHEDAICTGLLTLSVCVPVLLPHLPEPTAGSTDNTGFSSPPMSFEQLVYLGTIAISVPSSSIRVLGAKLLISLTIQRTVDTLNLLLPLMLGYLEPVVLGRAADSSPSSSPVACTGTLEALTAIVEQVGQTSPSDATSAAWLRLDRADPLAEPDTADTDRIVGAESDGPMEAGENRLSPLLCRFLPYIVVLVPPVLRLLADSDGEVRVLASRLFTALLTLFPLESSLPDPPGMDPEMCVARATKRQFIDSLLHPDRIQRYNLPVPIQAKLRGYQQDGVNWLSFLNRYGLNGILCDDLGLGKTIQTLCILAGSHYELKQKHQSQPVADAQPSNDDADNDAGSNSQAMSLVVCPSTLCGHWLHEVEQFVLPRDLLPMVYSGGPAARLNLQTQIFKYNLVIASYDLVRNDISFFQSIFWNYVVLDEGHIIKSSKSKVARSLKQLRARHRLILTGTPIQNRVCELWSLFDFLMPDFLGSESSFNARFSRPVAASRDPKASRADQRAGHLALESLHRLVLPFMLRRLKEDVMLDLPPKIIQDFACEMTSIQLMLYEAFLNSNEGRSLMKTIRERDDRETVVTYGGVRHGFQALRYLQAICNHPCLALKPTHPVLNEVKRALQTDYGARVALNSVHLSGKLLALCRLLTDCGFGTPNLDRSTDSASTSSSASVTALDDLVDSSRSLLNQHRALIFFQTREMLQLTEDILRAQFPWITSTRLDGSVPINERYARVTRFNTDPSIDLMLLTTAVGGLGLNLTGADTVIFVEHDWNPSKDLQAMDRVHRIGQRRTVNVYRLITQDSIEEQIMNLQAFKLHLANTVVTADNRHLTGMDTSHLFDRFTAQSSTNEDVGRSAGTFDSLEECYETEYDLDTFVARLK